MSETRELILFTAKQLGVKIQLFEDERAGECCWMQVDDDGGIEDHFDPLASWDWMGRGMEVCPYLTRIVKEQFTADPACFVVQVGCLIEKCASVDVPLMFWSCWMQMEEG